MEELIQKITEWPIIVQGALGSALFWVLLVIGRKIASFITEKLSYFSKQSQIDSKQAEILRLSAIESENPAEVVMGLTGLIYGAIHNIVLALIMVVLGLIFQQFIYVFGIVGYLIGLYFLFRALVLVQDIDDEIPAGRIDKLAKEVEELKK